MTMQESIAVTAPAIGTPVYRRSPYGDKAGWIAAVAPITDKVFELDSGSMVRQLFNLTVVFEDETESTVSDSIAAPWLEAATRCNWIEPMDPAAVAVKLASARYSLAARRAAENEAAKAAADAAQAFREKYRDKIPADAVAVIIAEYQVDDSDVMTDYFNVKTTRTVILAFSTHKHDLVPELRKAARNFPETAALADAPADAEHREKWSMGSGYYLKGGMKYSNGWAIKKRTFYNATDNDRARALPFGEWAVPEIERPAVKAETAAAPKPETAATDADTVNGFTISHHIHTKKGFRMAIVETPDRVSPDQFAARLNRAKDAGGWYSRAWGATPAGFAFKDAAKAVKFAESLRHA